jgi:flagellar protein FlaF
MSVTTQEKLNQYVATQKDNETDNREIDKRALLACASRLKMALDTDGTDMKAYGDALRHNQRLWTMFQVAICDPDNLLPHDLKVILLNLSRYVDRVSFRAVSEYSPDLLSSLIDINRTIAVGLGKTAQAELPLAAPVEQSLTPPTSVMISA